MDGRLETIARASWGRGFDGTHRKVRRSGLAWTLGEKGLGGRRATGIERLARERGCAIFRSHECADEGEGYDH